LAKWDRQAQNPRPQGTDSNNDVARATSLADAVATSLWPYAMRTASHVFNDAPTLQGDHKDKTPREIFTGVRISAEVRHHHTFGCPVYVTERSLQQGKSLSVWMSRAQVGINLGISPTHARSVALVLSLKTGQVSPQFGVKHDDLFETAQTNLGGFRLPKSHWQELSGFEKPAKSVQREPRGSGTEFEGSARNAGARVPGGMGPDDHTDELPGDDEDRPPDDGGEAMGVENGDQYQGSQENAGSEQRADEAGVADVPTDNNRYGATTRSGRRVRIPARLRESRDQARERKWVAWIANALPPPKLSPEDEIYEVLANQEYDVQDRASDPISFPATSDPDTMYWHQAMQQPDKAEFLKAAEAEVKSHVDNKHVVLMEQLSLPRGTKVLASVWSMKQKRRILSRKIYKWKARLNCHGGQQEHGINFWETYSPVVNWFSIRLFLVTSILQGWDTRQIDFILAFPQADVECDIYMEVPVGFVLRGDKKKYCLKLIKNIYGTKQAGRVGNKHVNKGLLEQGYKPSIIDPCVYYRGKTVFMIYVDNGIFAGPDRGEIETLIKEMQNKFNVTDEGDLKEYLGVLVEKQADGRTKLSQPQLIEQILGDLWYNDRTKPKPTPAPGGQVLERELDAEPMNDNFHYRSVIGKAKKLEKSTRPDIAVAVHQCA
jgi:hypothetical protein